MTDAQRCKLFKGALVLHPDRTQAPAKEDILVCGDTIAAVGDDVPAKLQGLAPEVVDVSDKLITPGLINAHYHSHDVLLRGCFENLPLDVWILYSSPGSYSRRDNDKVALRTLAGAAECLLSGITTVQDMVSVVGADREHCRAILDAYEQSGVRVALGLQASDRVQPEATHLLHDHPSGKCARQPAEVLDITQTKALIEELLQGAPQPRLDWVLAPSAPQRCSEDFLCWVAAQSRKRRCRVFTHVYETKGQAVLARKLYERMRAHLRYLKARAC
ncbi:5'-deoxyadenosine deaminase [Castellaniella defragrans]